MNKASRIIHIKRTLAGGAIIEVVVWQVPQPVPPSSHSYKYRLAYVVDGVRMVGYDNERGKGDHKHIRSVQHSYTFTSFPQLLADFAADVTKVRGEPI